MDNGLLISQEKSYSLSSFFLLYSYNIMSKILINAGLIMEHSKTNERVQKGIAHWNKQNHAVPAPNCILKVRGEIIKDES